jgi:hypothetical protein
VDVGHSQQHRERGRKRYCEPMSSVPSEHPPLVVTDVEVVIANRRGEARTRRQRLASWIFQIAELHGSI